MLAFEKKADAPAGEIAGTIQSQLAQWPVQLHLISPTAPYYQDSDVLLTADCVAYALGDFHREFLKDHTLAIACPKLDSNQDIYAQKITSWVDDAGINSLHVLIMQVPCCGGLLNLTRNAVENAQRKIPINYTVVGVQGDILEQNCI
ncbi:MAG: 4Fe-4S ferredoxin [Deltaproteobacteria bacterium]|nr:4Fe-4S ferredoxin [Deltaproteobacteria bacterium]